MSERTTRYLGPFFWFAMILGALVLTHEASSKELSKAQLEYLNKLKGPVVVRGDYFKAITVAFKDFELTTLNANASKARAAGSEISESLIWLSKIENYDIDVELGDGVIAVWFSPTVRGDAPMILGGNTKYEIDSQSFAIVRKGTSK